MRETRFGTAVFAAALFLVLASLAPAAEACTWHTLTKETPRSTTRVWREIPPNPNATEVWALKLGVKDGHYPVRVTYDSKSEAGAVKTEKLEVVEGDTGTPIWFDEEVNVTKVEICI